MTRRPFAHDAVLAMATAADDRAPGGSITVARCRQSAAGAAVPPDEQWMRAAIDGGRTGPLTTAASAVRPAAREHADRPTRSRRPPPPRTPRRGRAAARAPVRCG